MRSNAPAAKSCAARCSQSRLTGSDEIESFQDQLPEPRLAQDSQIAAVPAVYWRYSTNVASLAAGRTHAIGEYSDRLRAALGDRLVELRLFGSVARGDDRPDSDIDILVIIRGSAEERGRTEREAVDIAFDVNLQHDVYISPRVLTEDLLTDPVWGQTPFLKAVRREGVTL